MAFCATVYESIQVFAPDTWEHYYYNPTLSPFKVPFVLSMFLVGLWLFLVVLLAVLDDLFRQLSPAAAVFYLLGLASSCIFCYFFFILTTHIYVGYVFLALRRQADAQGCVSALWSCERVKLSARNRTPVRK